MAEAGRGFSLPCGAWGGQAASRGRESPCASGGGAKQHLAYRPPPAPGACCVGPLRSGADGTGAPSSEYPFSVPVLVRARLQPRPGDRGPSLATSVAPMEARPRTPRAQGPRLRGPKQHKYSYRGGPLHPPPPHSHVDLAAAAPRSAQNLAHIAQRTSRGGRAAAAGASLPRCAGLVPAGSSPALRLRAAPHAPRPVLRALRPAAPRHLCFCSVKRTCRFTTGSYLRSASFRVIVRGFFFAV